MAKGDKQDLDRQAKAAKELAAKQHESARVKQGGPASGNPRGGLCG